MNRRSLENLAAAAAVLVVVLAAFLAVGQTHLWFERAEVQRSADAAGNVLLAQDALAEVVALAEPTTDILDIPPRINPGRGPAQNRYQPVVLRVLTGINRGKLFLANNILHFKPSSNALIGKGSLVHVSVSTSGHGVQDVLICKPIVRYPLLIYLIAGLLCAVILFMRTRGVAFAGALAFTVLASSFVLFPLILRGFSPLGAVAIYALLMMVMLTLFLGGAGKKALAAILGACGGLIVAVAVVLAASGPLKLSGFASTFSVALREAVGGDVELGFVRLRMCGTVICILGIVLDLGVSIASAVEKVSMENRGIRRSAALKAGMRMSRDVTGTMLLTLIFVWAGTKLHAMMLPRGLGISFRELLNTEAMAVEILRLVAGGLGLLATGPITALVSVAFFARAGHPARSLKQVGKKRLPAWPLTVVICVEAALCIACAGMLLKTACELSPSSGAEAGAVTTSDLVSADDHYSYAVVRLKEGDQPQAVLALWGALALDPDHGPAHRDLAYIFAGRKWFPPARAEIDRALKLLPDDSLTHYIAGVVMAWQNMPSEAERELKRALELDPNNANASEALRALFGAEADGAGGGR